MLSYRFYARAFDSGKQLAPALAPISGTGSDCNVDQSFRQLLSKMQTRDKEKEEKEVKSDNLTGSLCLLPNQAP